MTINWEFEQAWLKKLENGLDAIAGVELREQVMEGSDSLSSEIAPEAVVMWTLAMLERLSLLLDIQAAQQVMTTCACRYSKKNLQPIRKAYERSHEVAVAHQLLQESFETFLRETLRMDEEMVGEVVDRGWGVAGIHRDNTVIATKIPKSGNLVSYLQEPDHERKRHLYCHCPRIRHVVSKAGRVPRLYCYCGAGFYKGIWEEILQRPVEVEVMETVLDGGDVCKIAVYLPLDA
jgi:hypothetical protein